MCEVIDFNKYRQKQPDKKTLNAFQTSEELGIAIQKLIQQLRGMPLKQIS